VEMKSSLRKTVERGSVPLMESKYTESSIALFVLIRGAQGHSARTIGSTSLIADGPVS